MHILLFLVLLPMLSHGQIENEILESPPGCGLKIITQESPEGNSISGEYPWVALIGYEDLEQREKKFYACTGALINDLYVITTAVCLSQSHSNFQMSHVRLGEHNIQEEVDCHEQGDNPCASLTFSVDLQIVRAVPHPLYNDNELQSNNIALIQIEDIDFQAFDGFISPICLPPAEFDPRSLLRDEFGEVVGWDFGSGHPNSVLMKERLLLAEDKECEALFTGYQPEIEICMKSENIRNRCTGDSGSPLTVAGSNESLLLGILSYGPLPCGFSDSPSVFTSIAFFRDWIDTIVQEF